MSTIPRPEYPRPQFYRKDWLNLNGQWSYELDLSESGVDDDALVFGHPAQGKIPDRSRTAVSAGIYSQEITVPFCPESPLSGVNFKDFIPSIFYARKITVPADWQGKQILLHFGGVDNTAMVYIDGKFAGRHKGGQTSFEVDITTLVTPGKEHILTLHATDRIKEGLSGSGKQSRCYQSYGCFYTRVTGIWSTVWLEAVDFAGLKRCRIIPDLDNGAFTFIPEYYNIGSGYRLEITVYADSVTAARKTISCADGIPATLELSAIREWNPDDPFLYDITFKVFNAAGEVTDEVSSYAGLRKISIIKDRIYLNNQPFYLRFVLDQGYYPDGIWTAPGDAALKQDIELGKAAGFNGARLHQKVFEERYHYWADKLGYLTWGEFGSWGLQHSEAAARENFLSEWREAVLRDMNHPSIITWCPLNETCSTDQYAITVKTNSVKQINAYRDWVKAIYDLTKSIDPTRPLHDSSGYVHVKTDIWSVHCYCKDAATLEEKMHPEGKKVFIQPPELSIGYCGQPYMCDEFGGFMHIPPEKRDDSERWGYNGLDLQTPEELCEKILEQVEFLINSPDVAGYCYTQLTDVEQEQNGIYSYDRSPKAAPELFKAIFGRKPAWSKF
ncbi:MAG: beta-glucuronidase [Lentisphaeria bacterium]|nr:beta-glucuronidase [Lentisphaeria bacterium]